MVGRFDNDVEVINRNIDKVKELVENEKNEINLLQNWQEMIDAKNKEYNINERLSSSETYIKENMDHMMQHAELLTSSQKQVEENIEKIMEQTERIKSSEEF